MLIVFITRVRDRIMLLMRVLMFIAIIIVLLGQICAAVRNSGILPGNWLEDHPRGKPMRVEEKGLQVGKNRLVDLFF